jgi:hypothetical protein
MDATRVSRRLSSVLGAAMIGIAPIASAQGYMAFLATPTTVTAGDAASYMRAGTDWDGTAAHVDVVTGDALPTLARVYTITTSKAAGLLKFHFELQDQTMLAGGAPLSCGDQVIIQIDPTNARGANLSDGKPMPGPGPYHRYELAITGGVGTPTVQHRLPKFYAGPGLGWMWDQSPSTTTAQNSVPSTAGGKYAYDITIPLAELGNPPDSFGLALAIVNDLGHSHGGINDASGTGFPVGMGLTPESDPGLTCGPGVLQTESATGNWAKPVTWGVGFTAVTSTYAAGDVTLDQTPQFYFSRAIRLGTCSKQWADIKEIAIAADWASVQQNAANNWYLYDPKGPCRMGVWIKATSTRMDIVKRRFLVLWGRPNIGAPQAWYLAGTTDSAVAIPGGDTPVSFIWNDVPAVAFSDHPCIIVYMLPPTFTAAQQATITALQTPGGDMEGKRIAMEAAFGIALGSAQTAQMNFANINPDPNSTCSHAECKPLTMLTPVPGTMGRPTFTFVQEAMAAERPAGMTRGDQQLATRSDSTTRENRVRIVAHAFGVSTSPSSKRYVYVETIGGLGWSLPVSAFAQAAYPLTFEVANPKLAAKMFVRGVVKEIPAPPRRILIIPVVSVVPGTAPPRLDLTGLAKIAETPMQPGDTARAQIVVHAGKIGWPWWVWLLLVVALSIILLVVLSKRRRTA